MLKYDVNTKVSCPECVSDSANVLGSIGIYDHQSVICSSAIHAGIITSKTITEMFQINRERSKCLIFLVLCCFAYTAAAESMLSKCQVFTQQQF